MKDSKKPGRPLETEGRTMEDVPTAQLVAELAGRHDVQTESRWYCREDSYSITIRLKMNKEECPECLR